MRAIDSFSLCAVFINDYHLLLVPEMIREKLPDAAIGIFIHATFPSSEIFRCLQSAYYSLHTHTQEINLFYSSLMTYTHSSKQNPSGHAWCKSHWVSGKCYSPLLGSSPPPLKLPTSSLLDLLLCQTFHFILHPCAGLRNNASRSQLQWHHDICGRISHRCGLQSSRSVLQTTGRWAQNGCNPLHVCWKEDYCGAR